MPGFSALSLPELLIMLSVLLACLSAYLLVRTLFPDRFLEDVRARASAQQDAPGLSPSGQPRGAVYTMGGAMVERLGEANARLVKPPWQAKMKRRFTAMGRPQLRAQDFIAHQELWAILFGLLGLLLLNAFHKSLWYSVPFVAFGFVFPYIWLNDQIKKRQQAISRALPYNIDLLTLSVEAGLDFQAALATVVDKGQPGPLNEELNMVLSEMRLGKTRAESLRNLAERVQISDVSAFVANLIQADKMGTSLGKVLRIQTTQMRINRTHRAEKLANEAPIKMLLPLIGCIFPTVFLVLFGPIIYRLIYGG